MATGKASQATTTNGAMIDGVIPNQSVESWRLIASQRNGGKKGYTSKEKEEHYAHWDMECANDEGPRKT